MTQFHAISGKKKTKEKFRWFLAYIVLSFSIYSLEQNGNNNKKNTKIYKRENSANDYLEHKTTGNKSAKCRSNAIIFLCAVVVIKMCKADDDAL